jgi:hypothetical protein
MKCLQCGHEIPVPFFADATGDFRRRLIRCPHCDASHVRELIDQTQQGHPVFSHRLWGHPATTRRIQRPNNGGRAAAACV